MRRAMVLVIAGCMNSPNSWVSYTPARGIAHEPRESVLRKASIAITDAGKDIESSDAATGIVLSKWFSSDAFGGDTSRFRVRVTIDEQSNYAVDAQCQRKSAMTAAWGDECDTDKRPAFVVDIVTKIEAGLR